MRFYYEINNNFTDRQSNLASLKLLITKIININDNEILGGGSPTNMSEFYSLAKDINGVPIDNSTTNQELVRKWWSKNKHTLSWIDLLSMILPILDPSKMPPHSNPIDAVIGDQLRYSSPTEKVQGHTLSNEILGDYGLALNEIEGLTNTEVNGYTKDNYMVKVDDNTTYNNVYNWVYEKEKGVLPRISYLVNVYLQYNKGDITKILSCIAEGVAELRKSEFNKYSPLLYQINSGGEIVPLTDSITAYFTKDAAEDALNAVSK